ncbi:hypothetical protein QBC35DRAFT_539323 [Podospora australis]|uniref:Uncharacterized protein n=1 Tax=Podospora australis TaxID=1536484 RepID=A0AAN6WMJ1_9PEZI|nr:hypothetical protein QBC35DRAFT_539323 [Podospora australis]
MASFNGLIYPLSNQERAAIQFGNWDDREERIRIIEHWGLSDFASEPGLPTDFSRWRTTDKYVYTVLLNEIQEGRDLARAFGLIDDPAEAQEVQRQLIRDCKANAIRLPEEYLALRLAREAFNTNARQEWSRFTHQARAQVLRLAWSDILPRHKPDLYDGFHLQAQNSETQNPDRLWTAVDAYCRPFINIEDLVQGDNMLNFLDQRIANEPSVFAYSDLEAARIARLSRAVPFAWLALGTIDMAARCRRIRRFRLHPGRGTPESVGSNDENLEDTIPQEQADYGHVELMSNLEWSFRGNAVLCGDEMCINDGALVLKIQLQILVGLNRFVQLLTTNSWHPQPLSLGARHPQPRSLRQPSRPPQGTYRAEDQPDSVSSAVVTNQHRPLTDTFAALADIADHECNEAEASLLRLQRDVDFFLGQIDQRILNSPENVVLDRNGNKRPITMRTWHAHTCTMIADAYTRYIHWYLLQETLHRAETQADTDAVEKILYEMRWLLREIMYRRLVCNIHYAAATSPGFTHLYQRHRISGRVRMKPGGHYHGEDATFLCSIASIYAHPDQPLIEPLEDILEEVHAHAVASHSAHSAATGRNRRDEPFSPLLRGYLSEASALHRITAQLKFQYPRVFSSHDGLVGSPPPPGSTLETSHKDFKKRTLATLETLARTLHRRNLGGVGEWAEACSRRNRLNPRNHRRPQAEGDANSEADSKERDHKAVWAWVEHQFLRAQDEQLNTWLEAVWS